MTSPHLTSLLGSPAPLESFSSVAGHTRAESEGSAHDQFATALTWVFCLGFLSYWRSCSDPFGRR